MENNPDIVALVGCSAALTLSGIPFFGPVAGARVGYINGEYVLNPHIDEMQESKLDLVVAGTADAVLMVESEAKELSEDTMLKAVMAGHAAFQPIIQAIIRLAEKAAKEPRWNGIFTVTEEELVSHDIIGNRHASIADLAFTRVVGGNLVKVLAWYDNEMGYTHTLVDHVIEAGANIK